MSDHPETDAHVASLKKTPSCFCETSFAEKMERDRNRWRSVAEQLAESLDEIRYPVAYMRKRLEPGEQLNGAMAIQLGSDPSYLKEIADKALAAFDSLRKEGK